MGSRTRRLLSSPVAAFVIVAFYVFALWQIFNHVYLMHLPMLEYHMVSLAVETTGAAVVAFFVLRELARKNAQLEELDRQKDLLANALVHDLRQPLTAVLAGLETVEQEPGLPQETKELLGIAHQGGSELLAMVNDLLDVTRLEAGKPIVRRGIARPQEFVSAAVRALMPLAQEKGLELTADAPQDLPEIAGDEERLRRVVMNLVGNALKFTAPGGKVWAEARFDPAKRELLVSVSDTGEGIPKQYLRRIFEKFAIVEEREVGARSSTGLGLTFCKLVVEAHAGRIWVESEPGKGSTFTFAVPARVREEAS